MLQPDDHDWLRRFSRDLDQRALDPTDPRYVDLFATEQIVGRDSIHDLMREVDFAADGTVHFLSGLRGAGKSTQLRRLAGLLEEIGLAVVLLDSEEFLNVRRPLNEIELLLALAGGIPEAVEAKYGADPNQSERPWTRLKNRLAALAERTDVDVSASASLLGVDLKLALKNDESFGAQIDDFMRGRPSVLRAEAAALLDDTVASLKRQFEADGREWAGLVVIVDSLDHARGIEGDAEDFTEIRDALERLFTQQLATIALDACRFVYCLPPYARVRLSRTVPHVKINEKRGAPCEPGRAALRTILKRRAPGGELPRLLSPGDQDRLIAASGGSLRDLFRLVQEVIIQTTALPASSETVRSAISTIGRQFSGMLAEDELLALAEVYASKCLPMRNQAQWAQLAPMFDRYLVLRYANGEDWFDVHPLVVELLPSA